MAKLGTVRCEVDRCDWDVYTDGTAVAAYTAYRRQDGKWYDTLVTTKGREVAASSKLEELFSAYVSNIRTDLIDPHRHLRRR